jgi:sensor histidine kinase regulating citrate/malate metabolism
MATLLKLNELQKNCCFTAQKEGFIKVKKKKIVHLINNFYQQLVGTKESVNRWTDLGLTKKNLQQPINKAFHWLLL